MVLAASARLNQSSMLSLRFFRRELRDKRFPCRAWRGTSCSVIFVSSQNDMAMPSLGSIKSCLYPSPRGESAIDWKHHKHPLPVHLCEVYTKYWSGVSLKKI